MRPRNDTSAVWKFIALVVLIVAAVLIYRYTPAREYLDRRFLTEWFRELSGTRWAPVVFVGVYAVSLGLGIPASLFTLVGGVVFGVWPGALYNWLGTMLGAAAAFLLARYLGRDFVTRLLRGRLIEIDEAVSREGFWAIFLMRLIPVIPFNLSNFAAGLTGIRFWQYAAATGLAILPGLTVVTWFAHTLWEGAGDPGAGMRLALASALLAVTMVAPWLVYRVVRKKKTGRTSG